MSSKTKIFNELHEYSRKVIRVHSCYWPPKRESRKSLLLHDRVRRANEGFNQEGNLRPAGSVEDTPSNHRTKGSRFAPCGINTLYSLFLFLFFFVFSLLYLPAQEEELPSSVIIQILSPEENRIEMDIKTSTLSELAAWCRSLGLSEGGTNADLARRLREYFKLPEQTPEGASTGEDKRKIITIESARSSEYFKIETVNEDYARLSGEVKISLKDGDATHEIQAWNILFNRTRNILTASGGVEYTKKEGDKIEKFRGDSITVDLDNWSSVFLGGVSERSLQDDNNNKTVYKFSGTVISRDEEEVTILNRASIGTANNEESLWSLSASRVWLLPGSDFAILNAVLKVGEIPVLYLPFFYYPADELIFHPVVGHHTRKGNFIQTTTYILGRPTASSQSENSLTSILGSSNDMEKKREGLFLRSTGKKAVDPTSTSLKVIVDYYTNLGGYVGTEFILPRKGILGDLNLNLGIGLTRTIAPPSAPGNTAGVYTPFYPGYDGSIDWNWSNLFSMKVPFRYQLETSSSLNGKYGVVSWDIPFYSDPLMDSDFLSRAEKMDWINMIQQGALEEENITQYEKTGYIWKLSSQLNPRFPSISPYISAVSISNFSSSLAFRNKRDIYASDIKRYSPANVFFVPDVATLFSLSGSIAGTPLSLGGSAVSQSAPAASIIELPDPLENIGIPRSPFEDREQENVQQRDQPDLLVPPELNQRFDLPRSGNTRFSIDYRLLPTGSAMLYFNVNKWEKYEDINWGDVGSVLGDFRGDTRVNFNINHSENFYAGTFSLLGKGTWRDYWMMNEEAYPDPDAEKVRQKDQSYLAGEYSLSSSLRPLYRHPIFGSSYIQYNLQGLIARSKYNSEKDDWDVFWGKFEKEDKDNGITYISMHQFLANISAAIMDKTQTFVFTAELPPRDWAFTLRTGLRIWITDTNASMGVKSTADKEWKWDPFTLSERFNFGTFGSFRMNMNLDIDPDTKASDRLKSLDLWLDLTKWGFTASFSAVHTQNYEYIAPGTPGAISTGWVQKPDELSFQPKNFSMRYRKDFSMTELWGNRMQFNVNVDTGLSINLQQQTNSTYSFTLGFSLLINNFVKLNLSARSENAYIYRYFKKYFYKNDGIDIPPGNQNNLFLDLFNSFAFGNEEKRRDSGFKMKGFYLEVEHYLGDWNAKLSWSMAPQLPVGSRQWEINNEVSFVVSWVPISEIKTNISYNGLNDPKWTVKQ